MKFLNGKVQFGRKARIFDARVPHLSALISGKKLPPIPEAKNYTEGMPDDLGMMLNDVLGDCTCAAYYHARQVWSFNAQGQQITEPDSAVKQLYIEACGYNPLFPGPGPGGIEQEVLQFLLKKGAPVGPNAEHRHKIFAYVEVDSRNIEDVKRIIYECGAAYIGFPLPTNFSSDHEVWDYDPHAHITNYGHAVILAGYDNEGATVISWGRRYKMTWAFVQNIVDEVYGMADLTWISCGGKTPAGLTLEELEEQMQAIKI